MAETAVDAPEPLLSTGAMRDAAITFGLCLILTVSLVGLKTDNLGEGQGITITTHLVTAVILAASVTAVRFLLGVLIWRNTAHGQSLASVIPGFVSLGRTLAIVFFLAGAVLAARSGLRTELIAKAAEVYPLFGNLVDLLTFGAMATFFIFLAMAAVHFVRITTAGTAKGKSGASKISSASGFISGLGQEFPVALLLVALILPILVLGPQQRYAIDTATQILIYVMLGWGLNVVVGLAGLLDLGYVAFYAVGAYSYALLATQLGWSFWVCLPLAGLFSALWGITLGFPVLRLRGDYLAIVTLAFGEIVRIILQNWQSLTGGPNGISSIPRLSFFGLTFARSGDNTFSDYFGIEFDPIHRVVFLYYVILLLALATNFVTLRLRRLPIGRAWEALREDEIACRSLGINTVTTKLSAFAIGAMFGGFAGSFFASRQGFISPESFTFQESALVLAIVVLGGLGSQIGVVVAAVALVGSAERFRELQEYRMLIFGLAMVLIMIWRPRGLMSGRTPSAVLHEARTVSSEFVQQGRG